MRPHFCINLRPCVAARRRCAWAALTILGGSTVHITTAKARLRAFTPMPHNKCESAPEGPPTPSTVLAPRRSHRPTRLLLLRRHGRRESGPPRSSQTVSNIPGRHINTMRRLQPDANINVAYPTLRPTRHNLLLTSASEHTAHRSQNEHSALTSAHSCPQ